jgi:hypothetical protein
MFKLRIDWPVAVILSTLMAGVAGARFQPAIPAVILLVLHSGCARGLGSVCFPTRFWKKGPSGIWSLCSGFILSSLIKALGNDYGHLDIRNMLVKVFWSSFCLACTHIARMLNTTMIYSIRLQTMNELVNKCDYYWNEGLVTADIRAARKMRACSNFPPSGISNTPNLIHKYPKFLLLFTFGWSICVTTLTCGK